MYTIDDPMIALILRFVGHNQTIALSERGFAQDQLSAIREYLEKFPPQDRNSRALEWIEEYARAYRERWLKETLGGMFSSRGCPDCPLSGTGEYCQIHQQWLDLLLRYAADEISTKTYVESSLRLLARHKEDLKMKLSALQEET